MKDMRRPHLSDQIGQRRRVGNIEIDQPAARVRQNIPPVDATPAWAYDAEGLHAQFAQSPTEQESVLPERTGDESRSLDSHGTS